jgi:hypothetical protein
VGRHSDSIDVTGPIDMTGLDRRAGKRHRWNIALGMTVAIVLVVALLVVLGAVFM